MWVDTVTEKHTVNRFMFGSRYESPALVFYNKEEGQARFRREWETLVNVNRKLSEAQQNFQHLFVSQPWALWVLESNISVSVITVQSHLARDSPSRRQSYHIIGVPSIQTNTKPSDRYHHPKNVPRIHCKILTESFTKFLSTLLQNKLLFTFWSVETKIWSRTISSITKILS